MKATELKIGSKVSYQDEIFSVTGIYAEFSDAPYDVELMGKNGMFGEAAIEELKAIPLTEEWLSRFGFNDDGVIYYQEENYDPYLLIVDLKTECVDNCYYSHTRFSIDMPYTLKYVHQLQNLYFALFQKELTL